MVTRPTAHVATSYWTNETSAYDTDINTFAYGQTKKTEALELYSFSTLTDYDPDSLVFYMRWEVGSPMFYSGNDTWWVDYSPDGGSNWVRMFSFTAVSYVTSGILTWSYALPNTIDFSQLRIKYGITAVSGADDLWWRVYDTRVEADQAQITWALDANVAGAATLTGTLTQRGPATFSVAASVQGAATFTGVPSTSLGMVAEAIGRSYFYLPMAFMVEGIVTNQEDFVDPQNCTAAALAADPAFMEDLVEAVVVDPDFITSLINNDKFTQAVLSSSAFINNIGLNPLFAQKLIENGEIVYTLTQNPVYVAQLMQALLSTSEGRAKFASYFDATTAAAYASQAQTSPFMQGVLQHLRYTFELVSDTGSVITEATATLLPDGVTYEFDFDPVVTDANPLTLLRIGFDSVAP